MNCRSARSLLSGYLDQELPVETMREFGLHLERCRACEAEYRQLASTQALLRRLPAVAPRPDFWMDTYERLGRSAPAPAPLWQRLTQIQRSAFMLTPALVAGVLVAILQIQPSPGPIATDLPDRTGEMVKAHLEAKSSQPLLDQDVTRLLLVDEQPAGESISHR